MAKEVVLYSNAPDSPVRCPHCQALVTKETLSAHIQNQHTRNNPAMTIPSRLHSISENSMVRCPVCDQMISSKEIHKHISKIHRKPAGPLQSSGDSREKIQSEFTTSVINREEPRLPDDDAISTKERIKCPFCGKGLARDEDQIVDHFSKRHSNWPAGLLQLRLEQCLGKTSTYVFEAPVRKKKRKPGLSVETKGQGKTYILDDYGFISGVVEKTEEHTTIPGYLSSRPASGLKIEVCPICNVQSDHLKEHMSLAHDLIHASGSRYRCKKCDKVTTLADFHSHSCVVSQHVQRGKRTNPSVDTAQEFSEKMSSPEAQNKQTDPIVRCNKCGYLFPKGTPHRNLYHPGGLSENQCPFCLKEFRKKESLMMHISMSHFVRVLTIQENHWNKPVDAHLVVCLKCNQRLHPHEVVQHCKEHKGNAVKERTSKPLKGSVWPKKTRIDDPITTEKNTHEPEKPDDHMDGGRYMGWMAREDGRFGSLPEYDDYNDESDAG